LPGALVGNQTAHPAATLTLPVLRSIRRRLSWMASVHWPAASPASQRSRSPGWHSSTSQSAASVAKTNAHAAELLDAKHRLSADLVSGAANRYKRLVRDVLAEAAAAGELDLEPAGLTPDTAADLLIASARGLESGTSSPAAYRRHLTTLVQIMIAGLASRRPADLP
jgi:hypothetical protein